VCCHSQGSPLAYATSKLFGKRGTLTVIGGPHAKAFPLDCTRYFDLVVTQCDRQLVVDILAGEYDRGEIIASGRMLDSLPSVQERWPEIKKSTHALGRWRMPFCTVPLLASLGCPYTCNFCIDWDNPYRELDHDQLVRDVDFISRELPGGYMAFHDPNFAVKFDQVMDSLEQVPAHRRPPYLMESSLSILKGPRLQRLQDTNCIYAAPGIESWTDYSNKSATTGHDGEAKMLQVAEHFATLHEYVPGLQGNLIFGLDTDQGTDPLELTCEFMDRTPFVWPTINIPVPFGGTPLFDDMHRERRILESMPFAFYYAPYLVITLKNYDPVDYYEMLITMFQHCTSLRMLKMRLAATPQWQGKLTHRVRTMYARSIEKTYRNILTQLKNDPNFYAFHTGKTTELPEYYHREYDRMLGRMASLIPRSERTPILEQVASDPVARSSQVELPLQRAAASVGGE